MISFKLRCFTSIALISFVMGFVSAVLLMNGCQDKHPVSAHKAEVLKTKVVTNQKVFTDSVNKLETKAAALSKHIIQNKKLLRAAKINSIANQQASVRPNTIGFAAKDLLLKVNKSNAAMSMALDTMSKQLTEYSSRFDPKDSLYTLIINSQDSLLLLKDSIITVLKSYNQNQADIISSAFTIHEDLIIENNQLTKQLKRQKRKGKLVALIVGIFSGIGVHQITNR